MKKIEIGLGALLILLISACSSTDKPELKEVMKVEQNNPLKVKDALIATFVNAPKPQVGALQEDVKNTISSHSAVILQQSETLIVARFNTKGSPIESIYQHCDLEYHFSSLKFVLGPYVTGDCSSIVIEATKVD
ncbi:hypothetical protein GCM10009347_07460 [Shewanella algicola]|uniref:Lipoprotein n=1 Tax=Shewanella algicola TaxID=640633 RepID=A0A9X1ZBK7_9GAMM|nr:hypothetical protein [Shewanella algicola]MCL1105470.1 hypothetical protein [Shewanella algicola]GGP42215.1 hypothetical protein GCM10009347_07460 [Shewanella algicola]